MPAHVVSIENMSKHLSTNERQARREQENQLSRDKVRLTPPKRLRENQEAYAYWKITLKRMHGISLLDDVDTDMLAVYCEGMARRDELSDQFDATPYELPKDKANALISLQQQEKLVLSYAEKLGLTPASRTRLAKKRAEERPIDPAQDMFGG